MIERRLHWTDTWVWQIDEIVSESLDPEALATFPDQTTPKLLEVNWNQAQYTRILSALAVGADLIYPYQAQQVYYDFLKVRNSEAPPEDTCKDYSTDTTDIITFSPQDPYTEPDVTPPGYLMPPFWQVGGLIPEFLPDWFADLIADIIDQFTGYEATDILTTIGSFPLFANWSELLTEGLPRFTVTVADKGQLELHFLNVPFGGRALVSIDVEFDIADIIDGIITEGFKLIELERDYSSVPPELDVDHIEEITLDTDGDHVIYVTFLPVVDIDAFPLKFGGGIRKVVWCPDNIPDEPCEECPEPTIEELLADEEFLETEYIPATFGEYYSETVTNETTQAAAYDSTPQSIGADIPVAAPNVVEKNAICAAVHRFVKLYASTKLCLVQSKNFIEVMWTKLAAAANEFYDAVTTLMSPIYSPNIFSCFVDDAAAITALQDDSAIEELACHIYDYLKTLTMSQSNFDDAILDASTALTGNAGDIACLMQNDNNQSVYINMLEAYQVALQQDDAECPCEPSTTYWLWDMDFAGGNRHGTVSTLWNGSNNDGYWDGSGYVVNKTPIVSTLNAAFGRMDLGGDYVIRAAATKSLRGGSAGNGTHDIAFFLGFPGQGLTGVQSANLGANFNVIDGAAVVMGQIAPTATGVVRSFAYRSRVFRATNAAPPCDLKVHRLVFWGLPDGSGNKPVGSVWAGNSLPGTIAGLFP